MADIPGFFNSPRMAFHHKNLVELLEDLVYTYECSGVIHRLTIPAGFTCDGASIPNWAVTLTWLLPFFDTIYPFGEHLLAAFCHDFIWMYRGQLPEGRYEYWNRLSQKWEDAAYLGGKPVLTFKTSNALFAKQLRELGVGKKERRAMFLAVSTPIGYWNWGRGKLPADARGEQL